MANEDDNKGVGATGSWVGKGTGSGATSADQRRQKLGTEGASDHIDERHAGSGSEGGLGSGLTGASDPVGGHDDLGGTAGTRRTQGMGNPSSNEGSLGQSPGTSTGGAGGVAAEAGLRPEQTGSSQTAGSRMGETDIGEESRTGSESAFRDWDTSTNPMIASNRVEGTAVYSTARDRLGTIQYIMIDKLSGQSEFAVMSFGGFLGIGSDYYPIPWNKLTYDTDVGGYVVDITQDQLSGAPRYAAGEEPDYGSDYTGQIGRHYGL